jgi:NAD(P)-dependent dehydrogenase (short-subunit alcohol dehydrogenase family)
VAVEGARSEPGSAGDLIDRHAHPIGGEHLVSGLEQTLPVATGIGARSLILDNRSTRSVSSIRSHRSDCTREERGLKGKTVLFTGATRGMGRYAAIELARRGARVLVVGHNEARGSAAVEAICGAGGSAEFIRADMGDGVEVRALADTVLARGERIDVLIHSAGGLAPSGGRTREGVDRGFAQNFLGAFLLTRLLEERLLADAPSRVIAVGSSTHRMVKRLDIDGFMRPTKDPKMGSYQKGSYQMRSYQVSKFAVTAWIFCLARRWAGRGVTATSWIPQRSRASSERTSKARA